MICINKIDLVEPADLQPLVGVYSQLGYEVLLRVGRDRAAASTGCGDGWPAEKASSRGKAASASRRCSMPSSRACSCACKPSATRTQKGKHTTTTAELIPLAFGGYVVDTPGIRQFQLWDVIPEEVAGFFRDLRPYVSHCRFPDCTHTHEDDCAVKDAVADGWIDVRRYESYVQIQAGDAV